MFLEIRKSPAIFIQNKDMGLNYVAQLTSNIRINLNLVAEISIYSIKEDKQRMLLDGTSFWVPKDSHAVHLEMMYTHSTHRGNSKAPSEHTVNERYFYKLLFLPDEIAEFARVRDALDRITV
ncbi:MAG: hypothetical protein ACJA0M_002040 [Chitinophagales bacterium]|jgi:hypothetical protein